MLSVREQLLDALEPCECTQAHHHAAVALTASVTFPGHLAGFRRHPQQVVRLEPQAVTTCLRLKRVSAPLSIPSACDADQAVELRPRSEVNHHYPRAEHRSLCRRARLKSIRRGAHAFADDGLQLGGRPAQTPLMYHRRARRPPRAARSAGRAPRAAAQAMRGEYTAPLHQPRALGARPHRPCGRHPTSSWPGRIGTVQRRPPTRRPPLSPPRARSAAAFSLDRRPYLDLLQPPMRPPCLLLELPCPPPLSSRNQQHSLVLLPLAAAYGRGARQGRRSRRHVGRGAINPPSPHAVLPP
eukprot:scaffold178243_cov31-Tisochrysis_lutea.AAC.4